jgi:hypothetical protein
VPEDAENHEKHGNLRMKAAGIGEREAGSFESRRACPCIG